MDDSWGKTISRPTASADDRAERRQRERLEAATARAERRVGEREQAAQVREQVREARRVEEAGRLRARGTGPRADTPAPAVPTIEDYPKRRRSGALARTGEVQRARDTTGYAVVVDAGRMRELAKRGASVAGLAGAFGVTVEDVAAILAGDALPSCG